MVSSIRKAKQPYGYDSIIEGNFLRNDTSIQQDNFRDFAVFKLNRFMSFLLVLAVIASIVSYSMVITRENVVIKMHNKTHKLHFENIELQNKVDYARSLYNINDKASKINFLKKADKVLEVNAITSYPNIEKNTNKVAFQPIIGY